jgi:hypothetical protein
MGTVYLVDAHNLTLADSEINDTIPLEYGDTLPIMGSFPVSIPFGVPVDGNPSDLTDLITKKYTGLLAYYPGFTYIDYDDCLDATGWDTSLYEGYTLGERLTTSIYDTGTLQSNAVTLTGTAPSEALVTWDVFQLTRANPKDGILVREYQEVDAANLQCQVSFDNGSSWQIVIDGVLFSIPPASQGTNFIIQFTTATSGRYWLGSWAVLY